MIYFILNIFSSMGNVTLGVLGTLKTSVSDYVRQVSCRNLPRRPRSLFLLAPGTLRSFIFEEMMIYNVYNAQTLLNVTALVATYMYLGLFN